MGILGKASEVCCRVIRVVGAVGALFAGLIFRDMEARVRVTMISLCEQL